MRRLFWILLCALMALAPAARAAEADQADLLVNQRKVVTLRAPPGRVRQVTRP